MSPSSATYKKLGATDSELYRSIRLEALQLHPEAFCSKYEDQVHKPKLGFQGNLEAGDTDKIVLGAYKGSELQGICALVLHPESKAVELVQMYVRKEGRGLGIGTGLLKMAVQFAREMKGKCLELGVLESNTAAESLYRGFGFQEYERVDYEEGKDISIEMRLDLAGRHEQ